MPSPSDVLVSVVIPAFDAEAWIDETIRSVRAQTHSNLEIIIVDDGSRDATVELARRHAAADARIRVIEQANAGVAAARNTGWRSAKADLIAFVDADDLWAVTKIERQVEALARAGPEAGLAYCWYLSIDADSNVTGRDECPLFEGEVFEQLLRGNFVGNGSSALVTREALVHANGFEPALRNQGAQGCEDILFYCRVAERYRFALVPEPLLGYRRLPEAMSGNMPRMLRSWMLVIDELSGRHPDKRGLMEQGFATYAHYVFRRAILSRRISQLGPIIGLLSRRRPAIMGRLLLVSLPSIVMEIASELIRRATGGRRAGGSSARTRPRFEIGEHVS